MCFIKQSDCVTRCIAGQTIIVPVRGHVGDLDSVYTLNETGTLIWQLIDGRIGVSQLAEAMCREYNVTPEGATKDIGTFLDSLEAAGLIRPAGEDQA